MAYLGGQRHLIYDCLVMVKYNTPFPRELLAMIPISGNGIDHNEKHGKICFKLNLGLRFGHPNEMNRALGHLCAHIG